MAGCVTVPSPDVARSRHARSTRRRRACATRPAFRPHSAGTTRIAAPSPSERRVANSPQSHLADAALKAYVCGPTTGCGSVARGSLANDATGLCDARSVPCAHGWSTYDESLWRCSEPRSLHRSSRSPRPPYRGRLAAALRAACSSRESDDQEHATEELRTSVTGYVAALRNGGVTVEHAVISTKGLLVETIGGPNIPAERRALAERVVSWGIDAYYDSPPRAE